MANNKNEIKLPAHLQALVNDPKVQAIWNKLQEDKKDKILIEDVTPAGYGPDN